MELLTAVPRSVCPHSFVNNDYKGYLEDRRPNSQGDPYAIASRILKTISEVPTK
jgi:glutamine synthetase